MTGRDGYPCEHDEKPVAFFAEDLFYRLKAESGDVRDLALLAELNAYLDRIGDSPAEETK